jgi:hypothetical protein
MLFLELCWIFTVSKKGIFVSRQVQIIFYDPFVWKTLLLQWIFPTWKSNSKFSQRKGKKLKPLQNSRRQKGYTKQVPSREAINIKFSRQGDLAAGILCNPGVTFFLGWICVCRQPTKFHETWYAYHNTEGASTSSFIFQSSKQYLNDDLRNSEYKVILVTNITYSPETLRGNIYFESIQINYNTLLRNVFTSSPSVWWRISLDLDMWSLLLRESTYMNTKLES